MELIKDNPVITRHEIADALGMSVAGVDKNISKLKALGHLKRIGSKKGGHWEIVE